MSIVISQISKSFNGQEVLKQVNMNFDYGKIYGLVGRNGSGKTVFLKCMCGILRPDEGTITMDGHPINQEMMENFGVLIENPGFFPYESGFQNLKLLSSIRGNYSKEAVIWSMEAVGLDFKSPKRVYKYSMGMKQRLGIAQAIMENPRIILLDEPMNGLDSSGVEEIRQLLLKMKNEGKMIVIASHNREDIEILCDEVYQFDAGKVTKV